ncbi:MAG: amino acid permease [Polyangiales bacterium]
MSETAQPRRVLGPLDAALVAVGAMVGSGVFQTPAEVAKRAGSTSAALGVWAAGGALSLLGALAMSELGAAYPESGGLYAHLRRAFGPGVAFLFGWTLLAVLLPSSVAYFATVTAEHLAPLLRAPPSLVAFGVVAAATAVNLADVRRAASFLDLTTALRTLAIAAVAVAALVAPAAALSAPARPAPAPAPGGVALLGAVIPALWAYDGWMELPSVAGELRAPGRDLPRALVAGTLAVTALYLLVALGLHRALGTEVLAVSSAPGRDLGRALAGPLGADLMAALVALSTFGACVVGMLTGVRVVAAMGASGDFLPSLGALGPRATPDRATLCAAALALAYAWSPLGQLGAVFVLGAWPFYALGAVASIVLRRKDPDAHRPFRMPAYPLPAVGFLLCTAAVIAAYARTSPGPTAVSAGVIALGVPVLAARRALTRRASRGTRPAP